VKREAVRFLKAVREPISEDDEKNLIYLGTTFGEDGLQSNKQNSKRDIRKAFKLYKRVRTKN